MQRRLRVLEQDVGDRARNSKLHDPAERVRGTLQAQDAARVLIDEQEFIRERGEALADAGARPIVRREVRRGEPRCHAERGAEVQCQRGRLHEGRALLAQRIGELVTPQRGEIHPDAAEHAEGAVETVSGIALGEQLRDIDAACVAQRRLDRLARADDGGAIGLTEVELFELGVHLDERGAYPVLKGFGAAGHGARVYEGLGICAIRTALALQSMAIETGPVPAMTETGAAGVNVPPLTE